MLVTHQISLLNTQISGMSGDATIVQWYHEPDWYPPSHTVYLEIVATNDNASQQSVYLHDSGDTADLTVNIPASTTTMTRVRGSGAALTRDIYHLSVGHADITINAVRLIVEQDTGTDLLIATEVVYEIGAYELGILGSNVWLTEPKFHELIYERFGDNAITLICECVYRVENAHYEGEVGFYKDKPEGTFVGYDVLFSYLSLPANNETNEDWELRCEAVDSFRFSLCENFSHINLKVGTDETMSGRGIDVASARLRFGVLAKPHIVSEWVDTTPSIYGGDGEGSDEAQAQSFKPTVTGDLRAVVFYLDVNGTPTDAIKMTLTASLGGAALATANLCYPKDLPISPNRGYIPVGTLAYFPTPYEVQADTTYYLEIERTGSRDIVNQYGVGVSDTDDIPDGLSFSRNSGIWNAGISLDLSIRISIGEGIDRLVLEQLIINEAMTGTGEGEYQVRWDPDMFSIEAGTVKAIHSVDVSDDASNVKLRDQSGPTDLEGSDVLGEEDGLTHCSASVYPTGKIADPVSSTDIYDGGTYEGVSNSFVADGGEIFAVSIVMIKILSPGTGYVRLYAVDGSNLPTGAALAEVSFVAADINDLPQWQYFEFDTPYETTDGTTYCIAVVHEEGDVSNYYTVGFNTAGRGQGGTFNGSSWSTTTDEYCFRPMEAVDMPGTAQDIDTDVIAV